MIYAIGDIHGKFDLLKLLYKRILQDIVDIGDDQNMIVFVGDYIDRGPKNRQVLDFLRGLEDIPGSLEHRMLWGNHEQIFEGAMENPRSHFHVNMWLNNGGLSFLAEVGMDFDYFNNAFPWHIYVNWFRKRLELYVETEDYVFVHGGLDIRKDDMEKQDTEYLLWARHTQKDWYRSYPKLVVHGHTPADMPISDINRINVDTSWSRTPKLTAVALTNRRSEDIAPRFIYAEEKDIV